jgi:hypothetical protein
VRNEVSFSIDSGSANAIFVLLMIVYSIFAAFFLLLIGEDALRGDHPFQYFADSITYIATYEGNAETANGKLVGIDSNYLGPLTLLGLVGGNNYLVMLANVYMFTHSVSHVCKLLGLNSLKVGVLLLLSPITFSSLLSVNKEIFLFPFLAFALDGYMRRRLLTTVMALAASVLVRWQLTGFFLMIVGIAQVRMVKSRQTVLMGVLLSISGVYLAIGELITPILAYVQNSFDTYDGGGSGLFEMVIGYQNKGLYFLVFPIKALHLLFGMGLKLDRLFVPLEIYNDLFIGGHCLVALLVFCNLIKGRKLSLESDLMYASVLFLAVFSVTPVFAPRYLYLVFILWVLVMAGAPAKLPRLAKSRSLFLSLIMARAKVAPSRSDGA